MIELPLIKRWTGSGYGHNEARVLTQVKRTDKVALYKRTVEKTGIPEGYEFFIIKKRFKGQPLPGGLFEPEDREAYPSDNAFGRTAWHYGNLTYAEKRFEEVNTEENIPDEVETEDAVDRIIMVPNGDFSTKELAESNKIEYGEASVFLKQELEKKTIQFVREERRQTKGKMTKLYSKVEVK